MSSRSTRNAASTTRARVDNHRRDAAVESWLNVHGLTPPITEHPDWGIKIQLASVPLDLWIAQRSKIPAKALWLGVNIHRLHGCNAALRTYDETFQLHWQLGEHPRVKSENLLHRRRTPWPTWESIDSLGPFVETLEHELKQTFLKHVKVIAYSLKAHDLETLRKWLAPVCSTVEVWVGTLRGKLPPTLEQSCFVRPGVGQTIELSTDAPVVFPVK